MEKNIEINNKNEMNINNNQNNRDNNSIRFKTFPRKGITDYNEDNSIISDSKLEINNNVSVEIVLSNVTANSTDALITQIIKQSLIILIIF